MGTIRRSSSVSVWRFFRELFSDVVVLDLKQNYFALFSLPVAFEVDDVLLTKNYRSLQQVVHPDNFATASTQEKRFSMQAASYVNEAYRVLNNDLQRAGYLLSLNGIDLDTETDTQVDPMFLMEQMDYREQLESVLSHSDPFAAADNLLGLINADIADLKKTISGQLSGSDFNRSARYCTQVAVSG